MSSLSRFAVEYVGAWSPSCEEVTAEVTAEVQTPSNVEVKTEPVGGYDDCDYDEEVKAKPDGDDEEVKAKPDGDDEEGNAEPVVDDLNDDGDHDDDGESLWTLTR